MPTKSSPSFADDLAFLSRYGAVQVLESDSGAQVAVSALYQGRIMTSSVAKDGASFGWIHRAFIESKKTATPFDNYGGEDRFWLGPEGGQFGLYFPKNAAFTFDAWQVPHAMQEGAWQILEKSSTHILFHHEMSVSNWMGTPFSVDVARGISLLDRDAVKRILKVDVLGAPGVQAVAFESVNAVKNAGSVAWKRDTGLLSAWILAMFAPAPDGHVVIPYAAANASDPIVNDAYFGKVPSDRLSIHGGANAANGTGGFLVFKVDGELRGKIGLGPARAKGLAGSYSKENRLLTIVQYDPPPTTSSAPAYVNSMWEQQKDPYSGDVINSYNDGPTGPGKPRLGGFYEIETSSPALALAPGETATHVHRTFHIVGDAAALEPVAKAVLGVSLGDLE